MTTSNAPTSQKSASTVIHEREKSASTECATKERHRPVFTVSTNIICFIILVAEFFENGAQASLRNTDVCAYGFSIAGAHLCAASFSVNPLLGPSSEVLVKMGGSMSHLIVEKKELWRLIAPIYLHGGLIHFVINMIVFLQVGLPLERVHGWLRIGFVYILSGVFGVIMGAIFSTHAVSVGASGAIFGLLGASIGDLIQNWKLYSRPCSYLAALLISSAVQLVLGTIPMLDNFAHFFGFFMGLFSSLTVLILQRVKRSGRLVAVKCHQRLVQVIAAIIVPFIFIVVIIVLFAGNGHDLCPSCHKISCIPFPWGCDESEPGACWWNCLASTVDPRCSASRIVPLASPTADEINGSVTVHCPVGDSYLNVTVSSMDVSDFGEREVLRLCRDMCPASARVR